MKPNGFFVAFSEGLRAEIEKEIPKMLSAGKKSVKLSDGQMIYVDEDDVPEDEQMLVVPFEFRDNVYFFVV